MRQRGTWRRWKEGLEERLKALVRGSGGAPEDEERQEILVTPTSSSISEPPTPLTTATTIPSDADSLTAAADPPRAPPVSSNQTQVFLREDGAAQTAVLLSGYFAETEIGIARLKPDNGLLPVLRSRQGSSDSILCKAPSGDSTQAVKLGVESFVPLDCNISSEYDDLRTANRADYGNEIPPLADESMDKIQRPTTLSLKEQPKEAVARGVERLSAGHSRSHGALPSMPDHAGDAPAPTLKAARHRIKTPRRPVRTARLSLYDDSIMCTPEDTHVQQQQHQQEQHQRKHQREHQPQQQQHQPQQQQLRAPAMHAPMVTDNLHTHLPVHGLLPTDDVN